ncbi:MAG: ABC transporter ATP-binding protein [Phycisphaeraceae bacterium]
MIQTIDLRVDYDGFTAVHDLSLDIPAGQVFGLIGPNGAGKSSTIRVLATLQQPTYGEVRVGGFDVAEEPDRVHGILGYMPDLAPVHDDLKVWEMLDLFAASHFMKRSERGRRIDEQLDRVGMLAKREAKGKTLSRGMMQRVVLAKTLLHRPKVLLLDEPASGVDPVARIEFRRILREVAAEGTSVLVSSHILTELADMCDAIGVMRQGQLIVNGEIEDIIARMQPKRVIEIDCPDQAASAAAMLSDRPGVVGVEHAGQTVSVTFDGDRNELARLLSYLIAGGVSVTRFIEKRYNVEDIMLNLENMEMSA